MLASLEAVVHSDKQDANVFSPAAPEFHGQAHFANEQEETTDSAPVRFKQARPGSAASSKAGDQDATPANSASVATPVASKHGDSLEPVSDARSASATSYEFNQAEG